MGPGDMSEQLPYAVKVWQDNFLLIVLIAARSSAGIMVAVQSKT